MRENPIENRIDSAPSRSTAVLGSLFLVAILVVGGLAAVTAGVPPATLHRAAMRINLAGATFGPVASGQQPASPGSSTRNAPGCSTSRCAMGVVDYGVTPQGKSYGYTTSQVESFADISALSVKSVSPSGTGCFDPHASWCMGFQSNWVTTGVVVGVHSYDYWAQDVAVIGYDAKCSSPCVSNSYSVTWIDNIWNFSSGTYVSSTGFGGVTTSDAVGNQSGLCTGVSYGHAYICLGPVTYGFKLPMTIWTVMQTSTTNSIIGNLSTIQFYGAVVENNSIKWGAYYDKVYFAPGPAGTVNHPLFKVANKTAPNGLRFDSEWVMGGPGGGSKVTLSKANVMLETEYLTPGGFVPIRHAWSSSSDTAESVTNANMYAFVGFRDIGSAAVGTENPQTSLW